LVAAKGWRATGRKEVPQPVEGACPILHKATGRCLIYADRPFGCRTHFCDAAGGPYPRKIVVDLIRRLEEVDRRLSGDGPRKIQAALQEALYLLQ
jgi:Fe-S-cluster containining protein